MHQSALEENKWQELLEFTSSDFHKALYWFQRNTFTVNLDDVALPFGFYDL